MTTLYLHFRQNNDNIFLRLIFQTNSAISKEEQKLVKILYYKFIYLVEIWIKWSQKELAKPLSQITNIYFRK